MCSSPVPLPAVSQNETPGQSATVRNARKRELTSVSSTVIKAYNQSIRFHVDLTSVCRLLSCQGVVSAEMERPVVMSVQEKQWMNG